MKLKKLSSFFVIMYMAITVVQTHAEVDLNDCRETTLFRGDENRIDRGNHFGSEYSDETNVSEIAVKFFPEAHSIIIKRAQFYIDTYGIFNMPFTVHVYDDTGPAGYPGNELTKELITASATTGDEWVDVELPTPIEISDSNFYISMRWTESAPGNNPSLGATYDPDNIYNSFSVGRRYSDSWSSQWFEAVFEGQIRAQAIKAIVCEIVDNQLVAQPSELTVPLENNAFTTIEGGTGFYKVFSSDKNIASYTLTDNMVIVTGKSLGNAVITVQDSEGKSVLIPVEVTQPIKGILVAGSGPYPGNMLWDQTLASCAKTYRILMAQGYTHETILFLSADESNNMDIDGDGKFNEIDNQATSERLENAIIQWAGDAKDVLIFMTGHGNDGLFRINEDEFVEASAFGGWLSSLKSSVSGQVVLVYDSCYSGSFLPQIKSDGIISIASTGEDEVAFFTSIGQLSFSSFFFDGIFNGGNVMDAFINAKNSTQFTHSSQTPLIDDNGNGIGNEDDDGKLARNIYIGNGVATAADIPGINTDDINVTQNGESSLLITVNKLVSGTPIDRVWAVITPPDWDSGASGDPVLDLPVIEFQNEGSASIYEGIYSQEIYSEELKQGTYNIALFVRDINGSTSFPARLTYTYSPSSISSSCLAFSSDLGLDIPCAQFAGNDYSLYLDYVEGFTWKLDLASVGIKTDDLLCTSLSQDLNLNIPCASFMGTQFSFIFQFNGNQLAGELSWEIDMMSVNEVSD
ncbi:exported hypothetical protein [Desulfamplus magnetovallimortis]|uniref:Uncharacterized protein n=1 Tax=Desulfamplus magnetovallimortis TaxID=1246637 RepID=A0A1W1HAA1_9BACT|nr:C13 family peptidase [Desulfamplus magnetovallimortis]SLM29359.1 exported hypothetical protein [Desulfamplus magnetovallimortis]